MDLALNHAILHQATSIGRIRRDSSVFALHTQDTFVMQIRNDGSDVDKTVEALGHILNRDRVEAEVRSYIPVALTEATLEPVLK